MGGGGLNRRRRGALGEEVAAAFLQIKGYEIVDRNVWVSGREIDILARDGNFLVAVEVKLRKGSGFGRAVEAIVPRKIARVRAALVGFLTESSARLRPRIDAVVIDIEDDFEGMSVRHLRGIG